MRSSTNNIKSLQQTDIADLPPGVSAYLAVWDCNGLECLFNLSEWDKRKVWAQIQDKPLDRSHEPPPFQTLLLRARFNSHRHYEIYTFTVDDTLTEADIRGAFESSPQTLVDRIREIGTCLFNGRANKAAAIV
jgi:hypothetical protein